MMMKLIHRLICHFAGHISLQRDQHYDRIYYLLEDSGAYCQGITQIYGGRLYQCSRCGELHIIRGILSWEVEDLISTTLKDLPRQFIHDGFAGETYDYCRFYR